MQKLDCLFIVKEHFCEECNEVHRSYAVPYKIIFNTQKDFLYTLKLMDKINNMQHNSALQAN